MAVAIVPVVLLIAGVLTYALAEKNPKVVDIGRIMFAVGLFWTTYALIGHAMRL